MFDRSKFLDIEPYDRQDAEAACQRLKAHPEYIYALATALYPEVSEEAYARRKAFTAGVLARLDEVHGYDDFQKKITCGVFLEAILEHTVDEFTYSGIQENLDPDESYLFISNHRDIVLDCALLDLALYRSGYPICEMAIGDNLLSNSFIEDIFKLNGAIIVKRDLPVREKYLETVRLSEYFVERIASGKSVWVAQKSGRSKDGIDDTHPAIIKMLYLSKKGTGISFNELINRLRIVPTAISYQYNPNDINMSREEVKTIREGHYDKRKYEDTISMMKGIRGYKGKIHVSFGKPLEGDFERPEDVAREIDRQIHLNYKLWDTNYFAYDYLESSSRFKDEYKDFDTERFLSLFAHLHDDVRTFVLNSYANPVREALKEKE